MYIYISKSFATLVLMGVVIVAKYMIAFQTGNNDIRTVIPPNIDCGKDSLLM